VSSAGGPRLVERHAHADAAKVAAAIALLPGEALGRREWFRLTSGASQPTRAHISFCETMFGDGFEGGSLAGWSHP